MDRCPCCKTKVYTLWREQHILWKHVEENEMKLT